jgi:hypothetical protein
MQISSYYDIIFPWRVRSAAGEIIGRTVSLGGITNEEEIDQFIFISRHVAYVSAGYGDGS